MQGLVSRRLNSLFATGRGRAKQRRPEGVSRRRLRQLHVEPLEDRRVMTASGPLTAMQYETALATQIVTHSYLNLLQSVGVYGNAGAGQILDASNYRAPLLGALGGNLNTVSYSTDTADGQLARYLGDMYWQSLTSGAGAELELRSIPLDPLLSYQWHLINSGQNTGGPDWQPIYGMPGEDINVAPVWNLGYTGAGVVVAVIDSGVQLNHPDLAANIDLNRQLNAVTGAPDGSPGNLLLASAHGTAVAGLIGAVANNGIGGAGVAPGVTLVPINLAGGLGTPVVNAIRYAIMNDVDITNNSYGPSDAIRTLAGPSPQELLALRDSVVFGRDGLGVIHVWASGNGAGQYGTRPGFSGVGTFDSSNYDGYANSRYTIAVTGVDHDGSYNNFDGTVTNYMEAGANVLVAAPTGSIFLDIANDILVGSGIWTTDTYQLVNGRDLAGFNTDPDPVTGAQTDLARDFFPDTTYTSRFNGTSAATPIVSGVVALMLEANPNLSWRDVQEILVRSARQNDPLGVPTAGSGAQTKNPWIVNQTPIFHDPDIYNPSIPIPSLTRIFNPTLDPNAALFFSVGANGAIYSDHYVGSPSVMTNGAGYTVAQGRGVYGEQMGYGHGVVDAEMAVALAQQWHLKGQALPSELTYTSFVYPLGNVPLNIPAAERAIEDAGYLIVPGGIGGESGFIDFWNEYFADEPDFTQDFDFRGQSSLEFSVPSSNTMKIESVDVKLTITGDASAAMDYMRILLVSPSGTYSELNHYWYGDYTRPFSLQDPGDSGIFIGVGLSSQAPEGALTWTFNTNRSWGERSNDALIFDPITNEPVTDRIGIFGNPNNPTSAGTGDALKQGWRLVIENWDDSNSFGLQGVELAWHGSPIAANSQRVQGFVGVDDNGDDLFNFSRVIQSITTPAGEVPRLGDVTATPDANQESFAGNVTVTVRRTADGSLVSQFVTGHDGNYYFDLVPDNYTISIEDPLGRFPKDDATTPGGFLRHFQSEWRITSDWFRAWDYDETLRNEVKVGPTGAPLGWVDGNGEFAASGIRNINFLLDPGPVAADQVVFTGTVFADVNGDGVFNTDDINLPNVLVFGDVNRNGVRDPGEATALTDANGNFTLTVPTTAATVMNVGVVRPTNWTSTSDGPSTSDSPTDGLETFFVRPGAAIGGLSFAMQPPANNIGGGGANQPGILMGVVYDDANNSQSRQAGEAGASNITVYLDLNNSGVLDFGDISTVTNANGAFVFTNVPAGTYVIRTVVNSPLVQTTPTPGTGRVVSLTGSSTISNIQFGIRNTAEYDFGDLPAKYGATLLAENGARHKKSAYWLGEKIDYELDGKPSPNADGDDLAAPFDDEDGITFDVIIPGTTARLIAVANRNGGVLQGWVDWNDDGDFNDEGERIIINKALNAGPNEVFFQVPAGANVSQVFARFRYGEFGINSVFGPANLGEVEDYRITVSVPALPQVQGMPADADQNGIVDGADFLAWQRNLGRTDSPSQSQGDFNGDDVVDRFDLLEWRHSYAAVAVASANATAPPTPDLTGDGVVDGADFMQWQRTLGPGSAPLDAWADAYGASTAPAVAASLTLAAAQNASWWLPEGGDLHAAVSVAGGSGSYRRPALEAIDAAVAVVERSADLAREKVADGLRRVTSLEHAAAERLAQVRELVDRVVDDAPWQHLGDDRLWRDGRAADALAGLRRRPALAGEATADRDDAHHADDAFAELAEHFSWRRG